MWGETCLKYFIYIYIPISIHSPRVGRDLASGSSSPWSILFQSTLPVWGETDASIGIGAKIAISIHSPRVGRDVTGLATDTIQEIFQSTLPVWGETKTVRCLYCLFTISIHSPRVGRDLTRPPVIMPIAFISIHSPRVGRDPRSCKIRYGSIKFQSTLPVWGETLIVDRELVQCIDFNPLSPCGERLHRLSKSRIRFRFQSTLPVWGETSSGRISRV